MASSRRCARGRFRDSFGCGARLRPRALGESGEPLRLRKTLPGCGKNQLADRRRIIIG
jgi:hypothetical protein